MMFFRRLLCKLPYPFWFHRPEVIEVYDSMTRKLRCMICGQHFAMSDRYESVLPWDDEYEEIVRVMYDIPRSKV
jgi:hypothetical protein